MNALTQKLTDVLLDAVRAGQIAGANLLILKDGEQLCYAQAGYADVEARKPYSRDTIVRFYSMTKPITATAAMLLVERGQLDLGAWLSDYLPEFGNMQVWENGAKVPARRAILIKDLLNMTSGLAYPGTDEAGQESARVFEEVCDRLYGDEPLTTQQIAQKLAACALTFQPGERWMYGTSADILGAVIEKVSGMPLGEFLKKEFFDPLGMHDTAFYVPQDKQHRLAKAYAANADGISHCVTNNLGICYTVHRSPAFESGGTGLCGTIDDYEKFASMLLRGGAPILKPQTVKMIENATMTAWQRESCERSWESMQGMTYGNLMRHLVEPGAALHCGWKGEYGWDGWLGTYFCNSPQNGVTVLMTLQRIDTGTSPLIRRIRNILYAAI